MSPTISVIMTTYNEERSNFILCVDSVLNQTYDDFEFIIVFEPEDDNIDFIKSYTVNDKRVKLIENKNKLGFVKSLNVALSTSGGKYMARIDSDDYCETNRFELQVRYLELHKDIDVLGSNITLIDQDNHVISKRQYKTSHKEIRKSFLFTTGVAHPSVMVKMESLKKFGMYNKEFNFSEDLELWLRLLKNNCIFANLDEYLVNYRVIEKNEPRNHLHWKYNFKARFKHVPHIWNPLMAGISIMALKTFSMLPSNTRSNLTGSKLLNGLKGKSEINI